MARTQGSLSVITFRCGHATLASSHVLFSALGGTVKSLKYETLSGELLATQLEDASIELAFPSGLLSELPTDTAEKVKRALNEATGKSLNYRFLGAGAGSSFGTYLVVEIGESPEELKGFKMNLQPLVVTSTMLVRA